MMSKSLENVSNLISNLPKYMTSLQWIKTAMRRWKNEEVLQQSDLRHCEFGTSRKKISTFLIQVAFTSVPPPPPHARLQAGSTMPLTERFD